MLDYVSSSQFHYIRFDSSSRGGHFFGFLLTRKKSSMGDLLLLSPPGQINDCYNDLISLGQVDMGLFKQYNINQSIPIKTQDGVIVLGPDSVWQDDLLLFNNSTYQVDHVKLEAHVVQQGTPDADPTRYDKRICTSTRIKLE